MYYYTSILNFNLKINHSFLLTTMNLTNNFNNVLDKIPFNHAIFTKSRIYQKMNNLLNTYDIYVLTSHNDKFVWEKTENYNDIFIQCDCVDFNDLRCTTENNKYLTIYKIYEDLATDSMIYNGTNNLVWNKLNINLDINNLVTFSLLDLSSHINLVKEDTFLNNYEPFHGWGNLLERDPPDNFLSSTGDLDDSVDLNNYQCSDNNFKYPDMDDEESIHEGDIQEELIVEIPYEEYRIDPYDNEYYTKDEFYEYYGTLSIWEHQDPKKILLREEYYHFTNTFCHLSEKKFIFLFKQYEKTF